MPLWDALGTSREVHVDQGPIRVWERGEGPPVVFVHGALVNALLWRKVVPLLAGSARCISPDLPMGSHPAPMRPDADLSIRGLAKLVAQLLEELDLRDVTLVGNDTGGAISQVVATRHPERLGRLVLTPCDAFDNFLPPRFKYLQVLARIPGALWLTGQTQRPRAARRLPIAFGALTKDPIPDEVLDEWVRPGLSDRLIRRDAGKLLRGISKRYTIEAAERLKTFDKPALLVWAKGEKLFPEAHAHALAKIIPNSKVILIDGARTFVSEDKPKELADAIRDFLPGA